MACATKVAAPAATRRATAQEPQHPHRGAPATFVTVATGNDVFWRVEAPAKAIGARTIFVRTARDAERVFRSPNRSRVFPWVIRAHGADQSVRVLSTEREWKRYVSGSPLVSHVRAEFPKIEGAAVFTRPCLARATLARTMQREGVRTIAETDDNYFCDSTLNLFLRSQDYGDEGREQHAKAMASMTANVFSTAWLRDRYHREYRQRFGKRGLPEMHVCRNHIPRSMWPERVERDGPLRVGFMGSTSHVWDINLAYAAFHAAKGMGCETWMIGYSPADPEPGVPDTYTDESGETFALRSEKSKAAVAKWAAVVDQHRPWIAPTDYHRAALPLDIGLAPLLWNDFTAGKSDVKAIEYAISGAACVVSNHPVYAAGGWKHEVNCLMAGDYRELAEQTVRLIRDPGLRYGLVTAAQELVWRERNETVMESEWREAVRG